jgi:aspartate aminotransferase-like enzyme
MNKNHVKLHIPGPVEVSEKTFNAFCSPVIGHRGQGFKDLYAGIMPQLQQLFYTQRPVYLSTSSAWGVMEGAIRNLVSKKVLNCMNGAFSDKWFDVAQRCGKAAQSLKVEWGHPIRAEQVEAKLSTGEFDALTLIHNETSTGTMSPIYEIAALKKKFPDVMFIVDAVSSLTATKIEFDALGIDVLLAGCQKALAMPPGLTVFTCSEAALKKAAMMADRGYYFDFLEFQKNAEGFMTPSTPSIGHVYALASKLEDIFAEGLDARYQRHKKLAGLTRRWARNHGFELFPEPGFESVTLTCVSNGAPGKKGRVIDVAKFQKILKDHHHVLIDGGYGPIKGLTFRISNMGDETEQTMARLYQQMDDALNAG